jgi:hypothetical protein
VPSHFNGTDGLESLLAGVARETYASADPAAGLSHRMGCESRGCCSSALGIADLAKHSHRDVLHLTSHETGHRPLLRYQR